MDTDYATAPKTWWQKRVDELILTNLSNFQLTNSSLAKELSISERQLYRIVKECTGLSPNVYIRQIRLKTAYKFLQSGKYLTVKEVAAVVGFQKNDYFTRLFKSEFGLTPLEVLQNKGIK
ncbi:MAG: helix-turn-helix domain-containing protein [Chitinophagales bacterium]